MISEVPQHPDYPFDIFKVGDGVGIHGWSDVNPAEVIEVSKNGKRVKVRECDAELVNPEDLKFEPGGFAGHCSNAEVQRYEYKSNPDGRVQEFSLRKWRGRYVWCLLKGRPDGRQALSLGMKKFYDYNF